MPPPAAARPLAAGLLLLATAAPAGEPAESGRPQAPLARGDAAWERRAAGRRGLAAAAAPIGEAVAAYEAALVADPGSIPVRERLLRALYYQGRFATAEGEARRAIYARGRELAREGIERLAAELGHAGPVDPGDPARLAAVFAARPGSVALFFWSAAHWGLWGETGGALRAARQGVAGRVRDLAEVVIALDPAYEAAGGLRIRGRLHSEAPRIPLVTGWVSRETAVESLERAVALAPGEPLNRLYLADALLRFRPRHRRRALALLEELVAAPPRDGHLLEDEATLAEARRLVARSAGP